MSSKKRGLGKGLSALLENSDTDITSKSSLTKVDNQHLSGSIGTIEISSIEANPFQPRDHFDKDPLIDLANSIKEHGIIQPLTVRKLGYDKYQLISGERRFRASQLAGLTAVPCYVRIANDQEMLEMALVENIQRENLDAIEVALSFQRLIDECNLTQEELSDKVGKNRTTVTNYVRLLKLPAAIQAAIREGKVSMGHARAIVSAGSEQEQLAILEQILSNKLSVRDTEVKVREKKEKPKKGELSFILKKVKSELADRLDSKVNLTQNNKGKGKIVIEFSSDEDLNRIIEKLDL